MKKYFLAISIIISTLACKSDQNFQPIIIDFDDMHDIVNSEIVIFESELESTIAAYNDNYQLYNLGSDIISLPQNIISPRHVDFKDLFTEKNLQVADQIGVLTIIIDDDNQSGMLAGLLLSSMVAGDIKVLKKWNNADGVIVGDDYALYDYQSIFSELVLNGKIDAPEVVFQPPPQPKKIALKNKPVKNEEEEGC